MSRSAAGRTRGRAQSQSQSQPQSQSQSQYQSQSSSGLGGGGGEGGSGSTSTVLQRLKSSSSVMVTGSGSGAASGARTGAESKKNLKAFGQATLLVAETPAVPRMRAHRGRDGRGDEHEQTWSRSQASVSSKTSSFAATAALLAQSQGTGTSRALVQYTPTAPRAWVHSGGPFDAVEDSEDEMLVDG